MVAERIKKFFPGVSLLLLLGVLLFWGLLGEKLDPENFTVLRAFSHPLFDIARSWSKGGMALFLFLFLLIRQFGVSPMKKAFFTGIFGGLTLFSALLYAGNSWGIAIGGPFFLLFFFALLFREKHKGEEIFSGSITESFFWILLFTLCNSFFYQEGCNFIAAGQGRGMELFFLPFAGLLLKGEEKRKLYTRQIALIFFLLLFVYALLGLYFDLLILSNISILFLFIFAEVALALAARGFFPGKNNFSLLVLIFSLLLHNIYPVPGITGYLAALTAFLFYIAAENLVSIQDFCQKKLLERVENEKIFFYSFRGYQAQAWTCGAFYLMLLTGKRFLFTETAFILLLFLFAFLRRKLSFLFLFPAKSYIPDFVFGALLLAAGGIFHKSFLFPCAGLGAFTLSLTILYTGKWISGCHEMGEKEKRSFPFYAGGFFLLFAGELFLLYSQTSATAFLSLFFAGWGALLLASSPFSKRRFRPFTGGGLLLAGLFILLLPSTILPVPHWSPTAIYGGILAFALTSFYYMLKENYLKEKT